MVGNTQHGMHVTNNCSLGYYILQSLVYQKKKKQVTQEHRSPRVSNYPFGEVKKYNKRVVGHPRTAMFGSLLLFYLLRHFRKMWIGFKRIWICAHRCLESNWGVWFNHSHTLSLYRLSYLTMCTSLALRRVYKNQNICDMKNYNVGKTN